MTQEPRPTPEEIENLLIELRGGCDRFRDHSDYYEHVDELLVDLLMADAAKVIEYLQAKALTPEQVERAKRLLGDPCVEWNTVLWKVEAVDLLREVVGDE